jgi:phosphoglycolate phosphatase
MSTSENSNTANVNVSQTSVRPFPDSIRADAYLFDIDGTLLNSRDGVHYESFHSAVRTVFGVDSRIDGVPVHGNTDVGILRAVLRREGVSDAAFDRGIDQARYHMCEEVQRNAAALRPELCPSIRELLEILSAGGKLLGVASGNLEAIAWAKLQTAGLRHFFAFGSFSDRHELRQDIFAWGIAQVRSRLGPQATVCIVGDTPADVEAAHLVGAPVIAVATGIFDIAILEACGPDLCVSCCSDLLSVL